MESPFWSVFYQHRCASGSYRVRRTFESREAAQEFIDVNAMVSRLPLCSGVVNGLTEPDEEEMQVTEDTSNHFPSTEDADGF